MSKGLKIAGIGLLILVAMALVWGLVEPYNLDTEHYRVPLPGLPAAWEGETLAVMGDFQVGMWLDNKNTIEEAVQATIAEEPAAALLLGDFVYHAIQSEEAEIQNVVALVAPLVEAGIPTYAVLGNHDYSLAKRDDPKREDLARRVAAALRGAGITMLQNEALPLEAPVAGPPLYVVGIGSHYAGNDFPEKALSGVPAEAPRVVMMHHPESFADVPANSAPLAVAGHTHGGQISLPFTPNWSLLSLVVGGDEVHAEGWVEESYGEPGNRLYVNRGLGMSIVPLRILAQPELTFFELSEAGGTTSEGPVEVGE